MLIVYSKTTGKIKTACSGDLQTMDVLFGDEAAEYKLIWGEKLFPDDVYVLEHLRDFRVNPDTQQLELLPSTDLSKYTIASA